MIDTDVCQYPIRVNVPSAQRFDQKGFDLVCSRFIPDVLEQLQDDYFKPKALNLPDRVRLVSVDVLGARAEMVLRAVVFALPDIEGQLGARVNESVDVIHALFSGIAVEAWEDYHRFATHLSRMETMLTKELLTSTRPAHEKLDELLRVSGSEKGLAERFGMSLRELREWRSKMGL